MAEGRSLDLFLTFRKTFRKLMADSFSSSLNPYLIPPVLYLLAGFGLVGLALSRRPLRRENVVFALLCLWYCLLEPVFIIHQLTDDREFILKVERAAHCVYVYLPAVQVLFFHTVLGLRRSKITAACFVTSFLISLTTPTDAYITGLHTFSWGYMAKGGWAFQVFCIYGLFVLGYSLWLLITAFRHQDNPVVKRKQGYLLFAFCLAGILTCFNIPALRGIDFYPLGNFGFIPLAILGYGVIRHRLLDIRTVAHRTVLWLLVSALVLVPNVIFLFWIRHQIAAMDGWLLVVFFVIWFIFNYFHIIRVQQFLNRTFNKSRQHYRMAASKLVDGIVQLKGLKELVKEAGQQISRVLDGRPVIFFFRKPGADVYTSQDGAEVMVDPELEQTLTPAPAVYDRHLVAAHPDLQSVRNLLLSLMDTLECDCIVPLAGNDRLHGFYTFRDVPAARPLTADQLKFIEKTAAPLAIAVANALMFARVQELKNKLELRTAELTQEIRERRRRQRQVQKVKAELEQANRALEKAILQANEMTARAEKSNYVLQLEIRERQRAEIALKRSEEKYRLIAENTTDVIWTIDLNLKPTFISPSVKQLRGLSVQEAMAEPIEEALTPESLDKAMAVMTAELENEKKFPGCRIALQTIELEMYRRDGSTVWTEVTCSLLRDEDGKPTGLLGIVRDISERKRAEQELRFAAFNDILTGLYNRAAFMNRLAEDIEYAKRYKTRLALLFIDLDKFKKVNDTYGHEIGDRLLQDVAGRIEDSVRKTDFVARLGGDEFTVILNSPRRIRPEKVVGRICRKIQEPYRYGPVRIEFIGASIGVAVFPSDGNDVETLLKTADTRMYLEKRRGKDRCSGAVSSRVLSG